MVGWGKGFGGRPYPVFKHYYGGGLGSVRVFERRAGGRELELFRDRAKVQADEKLAADEKSKQLAEIDRKLAALSPK